MWRDSTAAWLQSCNSMGYGGDLWAGESHTPSCSDNHQPLTNGGCVARVWPLCKAAHRGCREVSRYGTRPHSVDARPIWIAHPHTDTAAEVQVCRERASWRGACVLAGLRFCTCPWSPTQLLHCYDCCAGYWRALPQDEPRKGVPIQADDRRPSCPPAQLAAWYVESTGANCTFPPCGTVQRWQVLRLARRRR
jgi:hypothetical protein